MRFLKVIVYCLYFYIGSAVGVFAKNIIPEWYNNKPEDNKLYIFGVGSGNSVEEAVNDGFNNVYIGIYNSAFGFVDVVDSEKKEGLDSNLLQDSNDKFLNNSKQTIEQLRYGLVDFKKELETGLKKDFNINFSGYSVDNNALVGKKHYVLISFKRNELFNRQVSDLNMLNTVILTKYASIANYNDFVKLYKYNDILKLINNARNKIKVINVIGVFNDKKIQDTYKKIENEYKKVVDNIGVKLSIDKDLDVLLTGVVNDVLTGGGVKVKSKSQNKLIINSQNDIVKIHNIFVVKTKFICKVVYKNKVVSYKTFNYMYNATNVNDISFDKNINFFVEDMRGGKIQITEFGF